MQSTMTLLDRALARQPIPRWHEELGLSDKALYTARDRQHLSPAVAAAIAEKLGEDVLRWTAIAAVEGEKPSACKTRLEKMARTW